jgi:2-dehydro-3-deoxygalactonokinase
VSRLVGVDWGTSSLRVARLDSTGHVMQERTSARGILTVAAGEFASVLEQACGDWLAEPGTIALVCGMAGSREGWIEAPYCPCPAGFDEIASKVVWAVPGQVAVVPGLSCGAPSVPDVPDVPDVMRGEETQVMGALEVLGLRDATLVLPGTHSKWVTVRAGRVHDFATFMTGEFYALLRKHSILARTMSTSDEELDVAAFRAGIDLALQSRSLLHSAFSARTLSLFGRLDPAPASSYLSGLVIGEELRAQRSTPQGEVIIVGSDLLCRRYSLALDSLNIAWTSPGEHATWRGLHAIARRLQEQQP